MAANPIVAFGVLLVAAVAVTSRRRAFWFVVLSIPFFALVPFEAIGHHFRLPEIALLTLVGNQSIGLVRGERISLSTSTSVVFLLAFWVVGLYSLVAIVIVPSDVLVHPYNGPVFRELKFVPVRFSRDNVTQFLLRTMTLGAVIILAQNLNRRRIDYTARWILIAGVLVGVVNVTHQASVVLGAGETVTGALTELGLKGIDSRTTVGGLPRVGSLPGEPGFTAHYLLYALGLAISLVIVPVENSVVTTRESWVFAGLLFLFLVVTTSTTGYIGLVVLAGVAIIAGYVHPSVSDRRLGRVLALATVCAFGGIILLRFVAGVDFVTILGRQLDKLSLSKGSSQVRIVYLRQALDIAMKRPIFGVGVGSYYGTSTLGTVLAETGFVGVVTLLGTFGLAFRDVLFPTDREADDALGFALAVSGTTIVFTGLFAKSIGLLLTPWLWFALAMPIALLRERGEQTHSGTASDGRPAD